MKQIGQCAHNYREGTLQQLMFIPVFSRGGVHGFLMHKLMMTGIPIGQIQQPKAELLLGTDQMQCRDDSSKFLTRNALWFTGKPYSAHTLDMDHTSLKRSHRGKLSSPPVVEPGDHHR